LTLLVVLHLKVQRHYAKARHHSHGRFRTRKGAVFIVLVRYSIKNFVQIE